MESLRKIAWPITLSLGLLGFSNAYAQDVPPAPGRAPAVASRPDIWFRDRLEVSVGEIDYLYIPGEKREDDITKMRLGLVPKDELENVLKKLPQGVSYEPETGYFNVGIDALEGLGGQIRDIAIMYCVNHDGRVTGKELDYVREHSDILWEVYGKHEDDLRALDARENRKASR